MSRIGKKPIVIPDGVKVELKGHCIKVSGSLGQLQMDYHPRMTLIANMVTGVSKGFERKMEIYGTGYNIKEQGTKLVFQVGFSHPVERVIPKGVKVKIDVGATRGNEVPARFTLSAIDKCLLGQFASDIRKIRPPEPYKGKGIRYADEHVRRKVGKAFASGTA